MTRWTAADIPDLSGRRALVTGASSGLGLATAVELSRHGAEVLVTSRDRARADDAAVRIRKAATDGSAAAGPVHAVVLDLASLASVRGAAAAVGAASLHLLVDNAGVMAIPRRETADGFEMQLGTNHLGHMALALLLLPALAAAGREAPASRVVTVSSNAHRMGRIDLDDLMGERSYQPWRAYGQSKLANLLFAAELERRLEAAGLPVASYAAHPGWAATGLQEVAPRMRGSGLGVRMSAIGNRLFAQSAETGALPTLFAATAPGLAPGSYVGPDGFGEQRGHPRLVGRSAAAQDAAMAARLWERCEDLIGVSFDGMAARSRV